MPQQADAFVFVCFGCIGHHNSVDAVGEHVAQATDAGGDGRQAQRGGLHEAHRQSLVPAREREDVRGGEQVGHVARSLNRRGIRPVLLKGAASLVVGTYPQTAGRFLSDLDLLVPPGAIEDCAAALEADGYRADPAVVGGAILLVALSLFGFDFDTTGRRRPERQSTDEPETP